MVEWAGELTRGGYQWKRPDGVAVYSPTARSRFRVHRPNALGYGFEDLTGPKGCACTFKTADTAKDAADKAWPLPSDPTTVGECPVTGEPCEGGKLCDLMYCAKDDELRRKPIRTPSQSETVTRQGADHAE